MTFDQLEKRGRSGVGWLRLMIETLGASQATPINCQANGRQMVLSRPAATPSSEWRSVTQCWLMRWNRTYAPVRGTRA